MSAMERLNGRPAPFQLLPQHLVEGHAWKHGERQRFVRFGNAQEVAWLELVDDLPIQSKKHAAPLIGRDDLDRRRVVVMTARLVKTCGQMGFTTNTPLSGERIGPPALSE
jgi:hypothetical protein